MSPGSSTSALAPDETETSQSQQEKFAVTDVFSHIEVAEGRVWLLRDGVKYFAGDLTAVNPDLERFAAERMGATTYEFETSHVPMVSRPDRVLDVIREAANAVQGSATAATAAV